MYISENNKTLSIKSPKSHYNPLKAYRIPNRTQYLRTKHCTKYDYGKSNPPRGYSVEEEKRKKLARLRNVNVKNTECARLLIKGQGRQTIAGTQMGQTNEPVAF